MKRAKSWILSITFMLFLPGCCELVDDSFCFDQVFEETLAVPLKFTYTVNADKPFIEARKLTATDVKNALKVPGDDFTLKKVELTSGSIKYGKDATNVSRTLSVMLGVIASTDGFEYLLLKQNQVLPLFDIPAIPFVTAGIKINDFLNGQGITEMRKILLNYGTIINSGDVSFILRGEGLPSGSLVKFTLDFELNLTVTYEVCRYAPLFDGGSRFCD